MSHLDLSNSSFVLLAKALPPFPEPYQIASVANLKSELAFYT